MKNAEFRIYGEVKGYIWMPNTECTKEFNRRFRRCSSDARFVSGDEVGNLREALLKITNDGDFQSCSIDWAVLEIRKQHEHNQVIYSYPLFGNDGNGDCYAS